MKRTGILLTVLATVVAVGCAIHDRDHDHGHHGHDQDHGHDHAEASHARQHGVGHGHGHGHEHASSREEQGAARLGLSTRSDEAVVEALRGRIDHAMEEHDFLQAKREIAALRALRPNDVRATLLLSDALVELGEVEAAKRELQLVLDLKPSSASYLRAAYLLHLTGDTDSGLRLIELALEATAPANHEARAWALAERGDLHWFQGELELAEASYQSALEIRPRLAKARFGLGRVVAARGQLRSAVDLLEESARTPAQFGELASVYVALGREGAARRCVREAQRMAANDPAHWERSLASCLADHGLESARAVRLAKSELARRGNVHGWDTLAWALVADARYPEALQAAERAVELGTAEPLILFHAGTAAAKAGDSERARAWLTEALRLNAEFHPTFAGQARETLNTLNEEA